LLYQIGTHDTRILVDIPSPLPKVSTGEMDEYMRHFVGPQLPKSIQSSFFKALDEQPVRSMPCSWLPPTQNKGNGVVLLGDAQNMRHPLTGGGMTVAFWDVVHLRNSIRRNPDLAEFKDFTTDMILQHHWKRKPLSAVVNILANALYALFSAGDGIDC
jgi:squalene monooxygenase